MSEDDFTLEVLLEFLNGVEAGIVAAKQRIKERKGLIDKPKREWGWNPDKIEWKKAEGSKGEFEKSEDVNNSEFKALLKDLAAHNGKLTRDGYFYWVYQNGSTVGRKKRGVL